MYDIFPGEEGRRDFHPLLNGDQDRVLRDDPDLCDGFPAEVLVGPKPCVNIWI